MFEDLPDPRNRDSKPSDAGSVDKRKEFAELSRRKPSDLEAERAFLKGKIELARSDPSLSDDEKTRFINELQRRLDCLVQE